MQARDPDDPLTPPTPEAPADPSEAPESAERLPPPEPPLPEPSPPVGPPWRLRPGEDAPPPRPTSLDRLGFVRQPATRWFNPGVLTAAALHEGVTSVFGSFLDKRELQVAKAVAVDERYATRRELWLDYVADTGDGFDTTATVACQVAKPELHVEGSDGPLPRGEILVLGGDEVYPGASVEGYETRLEGPWRAALAWTDPGPLAPAHPTVYAIPGNHDWYDGLTGFLRQFGQDRWFGGWHTHQTRSYFAVKLPHDWWLWGIDIQPDALIDEPQLRFFSSVARRAQPGDRLVLATAVPAWTRLRRDPLAFRNLAYLERTLLDPAGISLELTVAGDAHHYARYEHAGRGTIGPKYKVTSGGGGAFLHPTHDLPEEIVLGMQAGAPGATGGPGDRARYVLHPGTYPTRSRSRLLSFAALALPWRNWRFTIVPGVLSAAMLLTIQFGLRSLGQRGQSFAQAAEAWTWSDLAAGMLRNSLSVVMLLFLWGALVAFARPPAATARGPAKHAAKLAMGSLHLVLQAVVLATVCLVAITLAGVVGGAWFALLATGLAGVLGALAGSLAVGLYLALSLALVDAHPNEAFAAARLTGYRNFLRLHIDDAGDLTVYALGIDRSVSRWKVVPEATSREASWIAPERPEDEPTVRLIDRITIARGRTDAPGTAPPA
jgi:hypothetical protein